MFEILDLPIKFFNPVLNIWFFLGQFMNGIITTAVLLVISFVILALAFKFHKLLFGALLLFVLYGFFGIFSVLYFGANFKELEVNTPADLEKQVIGNWCKENNKITLHDKHTIILDIDGNRYDGTWNYHRAHIRIDNPLSRYKDIRIIGFGNELFLNITNPSPGVGNYIDLEYARCD